MPLVPLLRWTTSKLYHHTSSANFVGDSDSLKARDDRSYRRSYDRAMAKVQALSNAVNRSPKINDTVKDVTGPTFINPTCTRWSSKFYAVQCVVSVGLGKVKLCQTALKQEAMTEADMEFLTSYANTMKPLVLAMNQLQAETRTYLGHLIPTIKGVLCKLSLSTDKAVEPLVSALPDGINRRFQAVLSDKEHMIASVLHPQFTLHFLPEDVRLQTKRQVLAYVQQVADESQVCTTSVSESVEGDPKEDDDDLYSFKFMNTTIRDGNAASSPISKELDDFL